MLRAQYSPGDGLHDLQGAAPSDRPPESTSLAVITAELVPLDVNQPQA